MLLLSNCTFNNKVEMKHTIEQLVFIIMLLLLDVPRSTHCKCDLDKEHRVQSLTDWSGVIESPGLDDGGYPPNQLCRWNVTIPSAYKIKVVITFLDLENPFQESCLDYLQISTEHRTLLKTCGTLDRPKVLLSSFISLLVTFYADVGVTKKGFRINYTGVCSGAVERNVTLYTPEFPRLSASDMACDWIIGTLQDTVTVKVVGLQFMMPRCKTSPLYVLHRDKKIFFCQSFNKITLNGEIYLMFRMTKITEKWVGQITVQFHKVLSCELGDRAEPMVLQHWSHSINSPVQQSGGYVHNQDCIWVINVTSATHLVLTFDRFELNDTMHGNFCNDYVTINDSSGILFHSCDKFLEPFTLVTTTNIVDLIFHSDNVGSAAGFHVRYEGKCEGDVRSNSILVSPNYPLSPPFPVTCRWQVGSENFKSILIEIPDKVKLPDCKTAAVEVQSVTDRRILSERLCSSRPRVSVSRPVTLIYNYTDSEIWWGRIKINFSKSISPTHCENKCAFESCQVKLLKDSYHHRCVCDRKSGSYKCNLKSQCVTDTCLKGEKNKMCQSGPGRKTPFSQLLGHLSHSSGLLSQRPVCFSGGQDFLSNVESVMNGSTNETNLLRILISLDDLVGRIGHQSVYMGDVLLVADVLEVLTLYVQNVTDIEDGISVQCLQHFMHIVNNLVGGNATKFLWKNKSMSKFKNLVLRLAAQILDCTPTFIRNIIQKSFFKKTFPVKNIMLTNVELKVFDLTIERSIQSKNYQILHFPNNLIHISSDTVQHNRACVIEYRTLGKFFKMADNLQTTVNNETFDLVSSILSVALIDSEDSELNYLNETIQLVFHTNESLIDWNITCSYLNLSSLIKEDRWITTGCVLVNQTSSEVRCDCDTFSDFGILGYQLEQFQLESVEDSVKSFHHFIAYVGCAITILACTAVFFMNYSLRSTNIEIHVHEHMEVSLILFEISYILLWTVSDINELHNAACYILSVMLHYSFIAVCCWLLLDAVHLYIKYKSPPPKCWPVYLTISWGIPLVVVISSLATFTISYINVQLCWWSGQVFLSTVLPAGLILATLTVVFDVRNWMFVGRDGDEVKQIKTPEYFGGILIFITFSIGWTFAFIGFYLSKTSEIYLPIQILFCFFNGCTGVSVFLMHRLCYTEFVEKHISTAQETTGDGQTAGEQDQLDVAQDVQDVGADNKTVDVAGSSRVSQVTAPPRFSLKRAPRRFSQESAQTRTSVENAPSPASRVSTEQQDICIEIKSPSSTGEPGTEASQSESSIYDIIRRTSEPLIENIRAILAESQAAMRMSLPAPHRAPSAPPTSPRPNSERDDESSSSSETDETDEQSYGTSIK